MKPPENIEKMIKNIDIDTNAERDKAVLDDVLNALEESKKLALSKVEGTKPANLAPNIWRTIAKSRITKLAAAAVITVAVLIGAMHWLPSGAVDVEIPPELAQMPVARLLDLYFGQTKASGGLGLFDRSTVAAALRKALPNLSVNDIMGIGKSQAATRARAEVRAGLFVEGTGTKTPASRIVEASDIIIQARVENVVLNTRDLMGVLAARYVSHAMDCAEANGINIDRDALWNKCIDALEEEFGPLDRLDEYFGKRVKANVDLEIIEAYPSAILAVGDKLRIRPVFDKEQVDLLEKGKEHLIGLKHHEGLFWLLPENVGVYPVDTNDATVVGFIRQDTYSSTRNNRRSGLRSDSWPGVLIGQPISLDEAWEFVMDVYDAVHEGKQPSNERLDYWLANLQSEDFVDCWMAIEFFNTLAAPPVAPGLIIDAIERHLRTDPAVETDPNLEVLVNRIYQRTTFFAEALDVLLLVADEPAVDRILALYIEALFSSEPIFHEVNENEDDVMVNMFRLTLKHPGPKRRERFVSLFSLVARDKHGIRHELTRMVPWLLGTAEGQDIDELLLDMVEDPAGVGISDVEYIEDYLGAIWAAAAQKAMPEFGTYIEQVLANPSIVDLKFKDREPTEEQIVELAQCAYHIHILAAHARGLISRKQALQMLVEQYRQGNRINDVGTLWLEVIDSIAQLIEAEDEEMIPFLRETLPNEDVVPIIITAEGMSDPSLVPAIKEALDKEVTGRLLRALFACGAEKEAIDIALAEIDKLINDDPNLTDSVRIGYKFGDRARVIRFLGTTADKTLIPTVEYFTRQDVFQDLRQESPRGADELRQSAVLALARLAGDSAIPRLKELYDSGDIYIRVLAAVSLYYLGDDTGYELVEHFVNHTERSIPEVEMEWDPYKKCGEVFFQYPLMYLRSPRTEALLFERLRDLRHGFDTNYRCGDYGYGCAFLKPHKQQILPILVEQLRSEDREVRKCANRLLKELTGRDFGFCKDRFAGQQDDIIERWSSYVDDYLAGSDNATEQLHQP